ncbi:LuxR family transcriptional regulator [Streptomyces sp. NPDC050738]|uniref:LuxR family transcriptional regulator n=1 Tax=Streptomyces sp. NPDC050738 TaxID=3154744 RepID=UPI0034163266
MHTNAISGLPDVPQADTAASEVYTLALRSEYVEIETCVRDLGITESEASAAIADLVRLRLLHLVHGCSYAYVAVNPQSASLQLLAAEDEVLRQRQHELERLRQQMHSLLPLYRANLAEEPDQPQVHHIEGREAARGVLSTLAAEAAEEILLALPTRDPWQDPADSSAENPWPVYTTRRPDLLRVLLPEAARYDVRMREYATELHRQGGQVRTAASLPTWLMVVDSATAVVPREQGPGLSVIHDPSTVTALRHTLTGAWDEARDFDGRYDHESARSASALIDESVLRMLLNGVEDKVIARRLDISLRTCQRRVAELMDTLGARTRFQAGYALGSRSHTEEDDEQIAA